MTRKNPASLIYLRLSPPVLARRFCRLASWILPGAGR